MSGCMNGISTCYIEAPHYHTTGTTRIDDDITTLVTSLRARIETLREALGLLLDYTAQVELLVYAPEENSPHPAVAEARAALAGDTK